MADTSAWDLGAQIAEKGITARRERKQALSDEERQLHVSDLYHRADALSKVIPSLSGEKRDQAMKSLTDIEANIKSVYHPDNNPGAVQRDWGLLKGLIEGKILGRKPAPMMASVEPGTTGLETTTPAATTMFPESALTTVIPERTFTATPGATPGAAGRLVPAPGATVRLVTSPPMSPVAMREQARANLAAGAAPVAPAAPAASLSHTPTVIRRTPQQMARYKEAQQAAEQDVLAAGLSPQEQTQAKLDEEAATRAWALDWAQKHNIKDEALEELTEHLAGVPTPKARLKPMGKPFQDPVDKLWKQPMYDAETGKVEDAPMGANYTPPPEHQTMYQQQLGTFAASLGKTPSDLSWAEERAFLTDRYGAQQPLADRRLAIAEQNSQIMQANLDLRRAENNWHDYIDTTKQLTPLEKISTTSQRADEFVRSPSGAGDVSLVFAFIDATKPGSGFRFTETERRWITTGSRGVVDGALTRINQGFTGETLSEEQRQHMAAIIKQAATQANAQRDAILSGAAQINPTAAAVAGSATAPATPAKPGATPKTPKGGAAVSDDDFLRKFPKTQ